jgi:hypothetical protein
VHIQLEKHVEKGVVKWAREHGWLAWKLWTFNQVGLPDRLFIHRWPTVVFMEFKRPGGRMGPLQDRIRIELVARGFLCYTVFTEQNGIHYLKSAVDSSGISTNSRPVAD